MVVPYAAVLDGVMQHGSARQVLVPVMLLPNGADSEEVAGIRDGSSLADLPSVGGESIGDGMLQARE